MRSYLAQPPCTPTLTLGRGRMRAQPLLCGGMQHYRDMHHQIANHDTCTRTHTTAPPTQGHMHACRPTASHAHAAAASHAANAHQQQLPYCHGVAMPATCMCSTALGCHPGAANWQHRARLAAGANDVGVLMALCTLCSHAPRRMQEASHSSCMRAPALSWLLLRHAMPRHAPPPPITLRHAIASHACGV